ncbi:VOC family protein [Pseudophaeobacter sp.]|uniref:VOC family protein n=1 Tax=Pseudophaeobacter sp. TaxID=1971739 RepID=UPI0032978C5A
MIGYVTVGVSDMEKAKTFYCDLFADRGAKVIIDAGRIAMIGATPKEPMISVCLPYDGNDPQPGNGNMIAFRAKDKEEVDALYAKAMSLGATCEGAPGQRIPDRFYGGYVRDLDGNKMTFYVFG